MILKISDKLELRNYEEDDRFVALFKKKGKGDGSWRGVRYYSSWNRAISDVWLTSLLIDDPKDDDNFIENFDAHVQKMKEFINNYKNEKIREGILPKEDV